MIEVRDTVNAEDLRTIRSKPRPEIELAENVPIERLLEIVEKFETRGATLFDDGEPIAAGGICRHPGWKVAYVWLLASRDLRPYARLVYREVGKHITAALDEGLVLYSTAAPSDVAKQFMVNLGFKQRGKHFVKEKQ